MCAELTRKHARTFALASTFLPAHKQRAAFALYTFCRRADDIVDRIDADRTAHVARAELIEYRARLTSALDGHPADAAFRELAWAIAEFTIPRAVLEELLAGLESDLTPTAYASWDDVRRYAEGVASSVGEMLVYVLGTPQTRGVAPAIRFARTLGLAMQLTNILRDVGEDARRGRCYLPDEDLARFGIARDDVLHSRIDPRGVEWQRFVRFQIARARELYREGARGIALLAADARRCTWICAAGYGAILAAIERNGYDTFATRARVSRWEQTRIVLGTWVSRDAVVTPPATSTAFR
ncbi:MAG: phytoene/squalene synthase family protein [Gemmatimonadaceae bacterium]